MQNSFINGLTINIVSTNFLGRYSLKTGAYIFALVYLVIMVIALCVTVVQAMTMSTENKRAFLSKVDILAYTPWRHSYTYSVGAAFITAVMLCMQLLLLLGIRIDNLNIVTLWLSSNFVYLKQGVLIVLTEFSVAYGRIYLSIWIVSFILFVIVVGILVWGFQIMYSFYLQLKATEAPAT